MAIAFPTPNMGDPSTLIVTEAGITWTWNNTLGVWSTDISSASDDTAIGDTPPASPQEGDLWWNSNDDSGRLYVYYDDGDSQQWVEASPQVDSLTEEQSDNRYLSKVSDDTAEGAITFKELTTHEAGVSVTGGTVNDISSGIARQSQILRFNNFVNTTGNASLYKFQFDADNSSIEPNSIITYLNTDVDLGSFSGKARGIVCGTVSSGAIGESINFYAHAAANRTNVESIYGFYGDVKQSNTSTQERYNFYAEGNAPNFFKGNTYIGGTTSRNTRELWESTLTEEQKEQLTAGTFAIPANVSVPGDGSFVRQWWYDQQSAEDQALIDSGELEYPERLQAANFTDTFALGDNTSINLLSNGRSEFKKGIKTSADGIIFNNSTNTLQAQIISVAQSPLSAVGYPLGAFSSGNSYGFNFTSRLEYQQTTAPDYFLNFASTVEGFDKTFDHPIILFSANIATTSQLSAPEVVGYSAASILNKNASGDAIGFKADTVMNNSVDSNIYGFHSEVAAKAGKDRYNFFAAGTAPNYFRGTIFALGEQAHKNLPFNAGQYVGSSNTNSNELGAIQLIGASPASTRTLISLFKNTTADDYTTATYCGKIYTISGAAAGARFISADGSPVRIASSSSNVVNATALNFNASELVKLLQPKQFELGGRQQLGFLAPEIETHVPLAIEENTDEEEGTTEKTYDPLALIPLLTKALQEVLQKNEDLEARIAALEGA